MTTDNKYKERIPVTIITGQLGAGKTTLLKHFLKNNYGRKILVIQNEFSPEMGIESPTFQSSNDISLPAVYELPNGCLCCSARDSLINTLEALLNSSSLTFSAVIVETSGVAEPENVISAFWTDDELEVRTYLDAVVTVVDISCISSIVKTSCPQLLGERLVEKTFLKNLLEKDSATTDTKHSVKTDLDTFHSTNGAVRSNVRTKSILTSEGIRQILYANVLLLNKCDIYTIPGETENLATIKNFLLSINPLALILESEYSNVDVKQLLDLHAFDFNAVNLKINELLLDTVSSWKSLGINNLLFSFKTTFGLIRDTCPLNDTSQHVTAVISSLEKSDTQPLSFLWTLSKMQSVLGRILWDGDYGEVYRSKGLFLCSTACGIKLYTLQGVGELFDTQPVESLNDCIKNMIECGSISIHKNSFTVISKILFIGALKKSEIEKELNKAVSNNERIGFFFVYALVKSMKEIVTSYDSDLVYDNVDKGAQETIDSNILPVYENDSNNKVVKSPEELLKLGRKLMVNKKTGSAVEIFSQAIQAKLDILGHDCSLDASLAIFYLEYGDALLKHFEYTCDIVKGNTKVLDYLVNKNEKSSSLSNEVLEPDDNVLDEQLAWEMLELSRICYDKSLKKIVNDDETLPLPVENSLSILLEEPLSYPIETATKASYVYLRLGDMLFSQSLFCESLTEYKQSLHILFIYNIPYPYWLMPVLAIATCEHCVKNYSLAVYFYERALEIVTETLKYKEKSILLREKEKLDHIKEDLEIQLKELKACLDSGQILPQIAPAEHQNSFSAPQLDSEAHPVINLGIVTRKKTTMVNPTNNDIPIENQYKKQKI